MTPTTRRALSACVIDVLEARRLLAAPEIADLPPTIDALDAPAGKALFIPVTADDADGDAVSFSAGLTGDNADQGEVEVLDPGNTFLALRTADFGTMTFQLFDDVAPETVDRISGLAEAGYYDGLNIFRVIDDFVLQFGDPTENGQNPDPVRPRVEFSFDDEFDPDAVLAGDGQLAMANSGKDTNSSQFFLTDGPQRFLDGNHTVFGQLVSGFATRDAILAVETGPGDRPVEDVLVTEVRVVDAPDAAVLRLVPGDGVEPGTEFEIEVTATDDSGDSESSTRTFTVVSAAPGDSPTILRAIDPTRTTDAGQPITIDIDAVDPEGEPIEYAASFTPLSGFGGTVSPPTLSGEAGTLDVDQDAGTVTYSPAAGFTGPAEFFVYAAAQGATGRGSTAFPFDSQLITVGVGDAPLSGSARTLSALEGVPLEDVVVATFTDTDAAGTADDFAATIDWGDGVVDGDAGDEGDDAVVVRPSADVPGEFEVVGSHTYDQAGSGIPVFVTVTGDLGAQIRVQSEVDVDASTQLGDDGTLTVGGTTGPDVITLGFDGAQVLVGVNGEQTAFDPAAIDLIEIFGGDGDDTILLDADAPAARIFAGEGDDTVRGGLKNDEIDGGPGDDNLDGFGGNDSIVGGPGNDYLMGGTGIDYDQPTRDAGAYDFDTLLGGEGDDTLSGGLDVNLLDGGAGNDLLNGSGSRDTLFGGEGTDTLRGFGNADSLVGGDGDDTLLGDSDDEDRFPGRAGPFPDVDQGDTLEGGDGDDVLRGFFGDDLFRGGDGADSLFGGDGEDDDEDDDDADVLDSIEN